MRLPFNEDRGVFVSQSDIEVLLAATARKAANSQAGIFGPDSISWKINREAAVFLGAGRAALLQLAHPWVATALEQHSSVLLKPIARFHNTFRIVFTMIFGSIDQAQAASRHLYALHTRIRGEMTEDVGAYRRGSHYEANEISALRWVYATLVESAVLAYECVMPPLTPSERKQYYAESKTLAGLFGVPAEALPENWDGLIAYFGEMCASDALGVSGAARAMAHNLLAGAGSWIHPPQWYRALTASWMPPRLRDEFALDFRDADRRAVERTVRRLRAIYRRLPLSIRFTGPWHEASARIDGRPIGAMTRLSNRFWTGEKLMPFGGVSVLHRGARHTTITE